MTRKNVFAYAIGSLCAAIMIICTACSKNQNQPDDPTPTPTPQVEETLKGNISRPTTWTVSDAYDYTSSMTSIVKVDLLKQYPELAKDFRLTNDDLLGAFTENGDCIGVVSPEDDGLFFLFINGVEGNVTLRYWSGYYTNIFNGESFPFVNDGQQGTYAEPYVPSFTVAK